MDLPDLQDAIIDRLLTDRPRCAELAARHPEFVARVLRRLVLRVPDSETDAFFSLDGYDEFLADVGLEMADQPIGAVSSIWLVILLQILLPALIRAFLLWWSQRKEHRKLLRELRDRLARPITVGPSAAQSHPPRRFDLWGTVVFLVAAAMVVALLLATFAAGQEVLPEPIAAGRGLPQCLVPLSIRDLYDGDTFSGDILLPFDVTLRNQRFRIRAFDAWETTRHRQTVKITELELIKGKAAAEGLRAMLSDADAVYISGDPTAVHSYDRIEVEVWIDPRGARTKLLNVADEMRALGHERHE